MTFYNPISFTGYTTTSSNSNANTFVVLTQADIELYNLASCKKDVRNFTRYIKVNIPTGLEVIQPRNYQKGLLKRFQNNDFNIVKSTRQSGLSTINEIYMLWYALFKSNKTIFICSDRLRFSEEILRNLHEMYENLPEYLKVGIRTKQREKLAFNNGSEIKVIPAEANAARDLDISLMLWDNCAFINDSVARDMFTNAIPSLMSSGGKLILTSANHGTGEFRLFDEIYYDAINGNTGFQPFNIRCHKVPGRNKEWQEKMRRDLGSGFDSEYNV